MASTTWRMGADIRRRSSGIQCKDTIRSRGRTLLKLTLMNTLNKVILNMAIPSKVIPSKAMLRVVILVLLLLLLLLLPHNRVCIMPCNTVT